MPTLDEVVNQCKQVCCQQKPVPQPSCQVYLIVLSSVQLSVRTVSVHPGRVYSATWAHRLRMLPGV